MVRADSRSWIWAVVQPLLPNFGEVIALSLLVNLLALAVPVFVMQVYDRVIFHNGLNTLAALVLGMAVVLAFDFVLRQARARILQTVALRLDVEVGRALFGQLVSLPLSFVEHKPAAYWHALFRDVDILRNALSGASMIALCDVGFFFVFISLVFIIAPPVAWILVAVIPLFAFLAWRSNDVVARAGERERRLVANRDTLVGEIVAGRTTVKALALEEALQPLWEDRHAAALSESIRRGAAADQYAAIGASLSIVTSVAMTATGALAVLDQQLTIGALIAANMLSGRLLAPITQIGVNWRTLGSLREAGTRLGEVLAAKPDRQEQTIEGGRPNGRIAVEDVVFAHDEGVRPTLEGVDVSFPPAAAAAAGGMHAIIGRNGGGKSTLLKVLVGLYTPARGRVLLDGSDIAQFNRQQLNRWIGYVPQETVLFGGTLRHNIALRVPDASDEEVIHAARCAGAHAFIVEYPDGYATEVGEAGRRLSAGQRQRIAIARALVGGPAMLILDEPSNALDVEADAALLEEMRALARTVTVIVVTHNVNWLAGCETVSVLEHGRIVSSGGPDTVLTYQSSEPRKERRPVRGRPEAFIRPLDPGAAEELVATPVALAAGSWPAREGR